MKAYQSPEILWQDVDLADILTTSFAEAGFDDLTKISWNDL